MEFKNKYFNVIERDNNKIILKLNKKVVGNGNSLQELLNNFKIKNNLLIGQKYNHSVFVYSNDNYLEINSEEKLTDIFLYKTFCEIDNLFKKDIEVTFE